MAIPYENRTVTELKQLSKKKGISGYSSKTKRQLINALRRKRKSPTKKRSYKKSPKKSPKKRSYKKSPTKKSPKKRTYKSPVRIGPLNKGTLRQYGYSTSKSAAERHDALEKAVHRYGKGVVVKKLNAVRVLNRNRSPKSSTIFGRDMRWVQKNF